MLRYLVLILLIANVAFWGWTQGWFGKSPLLEGRDPARITRQIRPDAIRTAPPLTQAELRAAQNSSFSAPSMQQGQGSTTLSSSELICLETQPLDPAQANQIQQLMASVIAPELWQMRTHTQPTAWVIYMGKFDSNEQVQERKNELAELGISASVISGKPQYQPGLTLGFFREKANAERLLNSLINKGITSAKMIVWEQTPVGEIVRIPQATSQQRQQLEALMTQAALPAFRICGSDEN